jgi:PKD repeat protein
MSTRIHTRSTNRTTIIAAALVLVLAAAIGVAALGAASAQEVPSGEINVTPENLSFGAVTTVNNSTANVTVTNEGLGPLQVNATNVTGENESAFDATPDNFSVLPGESQNVTVTFAPDSTGEKNATLRINSSDSDNSTVNVSLSGTAEAARCGELPPLEESYDGPPTDPNGDGLCEDVNGDGAATVTDVVALFVNREDPTVQNNQPRFDFNGDEVVNVNDVQKLFAELTS